MRGIYNLRTLKSSTYSPIISKVFGTFAAFSTVGTIIGALVVAAVIQNSSIRDQLQGLGFNVAIVWVSFLAAQFLILRVLLHNSISPLVKIITSARNDIGLNPIQMPPNLSEELQDVYQIVNESIVRTRDAQAKILDAERNAAIAQTTQMLAHDVRKPFSLLRMALGMLGQAKDPAAVKLLLSRIVPEIDRAISSVDGMISDVMEVGSASTILIQEPASAESLIESTLGEAIRIFPKANISFEYDLKHKHMAHVHVQKIGRVFSNVVGNAFQAMRNNGNMWFKTTERDGMIQFCVGNSGSVIPKDSLPKLFDAFFTRGKKGGTGLGLAIAQKVVNAHGGRIWCESGITLEHPKGKVEFFFTLPIAPEKLCKTTAALPKNSLEIAKQLLFSDVTDVSGPQSISVDKGELTLEDDIVHALHATGRSLRVLIVDDEAIYRSALSTFLTRTEALSGCLTITRTEDSEEALKALSIQDYDLIITDVDMGVASVNGFELVAELRKRNSKALVCVHSNRAVLECESFKN
jgi:signal transduction histidine kinase